jgi:hypothetical protein
MPSIFKRGNVRRWGTGIDAPIVEWNEWKWLVSWNTIAKLNTTESVLGRRSKSRRRDDFPFPDYAS